MDRFSPEYLILHDYGGSPGATPSFNPYHTLVSGGRVNYRDPKNPYGAPAPHAYKLNPKSIGLSWGGKVGGSPSKEEFALIKQEYDAIKKQFPNIKVMSHGEAYQQTRGTGQQASRDGRGLEEASWRKFLDGNLPYEPGTVAPAGPTPMGQRSLTAFAGVQKSQPPTTGTPQPMPNMLDVGGQAPVMDPAEVQRRQKLAQVLMQNGQDPGNMRHWSQALGAVLNTGAGVYQGKQAAQGLAQGQQSGNQALAQLLMGGDASAAMANPYSAPDAMKYQQDQKMLAERTAAAERLQRSKIEAQNADPLRQAQIEKMRAEAEALKAKPAMDQQRLDQLQRMGLDPESAEGLAYRANGKLPADATKMMLQKQRKQQQSPKVAEGLKYLLGAANKYDDAAFSNALGPIQGADPDQMGLLAAGPANVSRAFGEVANMFQGGNATPNEVRSYVKGGTLALSTAIKPLIRDPGEGVWTDADQALLNTIVGDLAQAGSKAEYKRRLKDVSERVKANFGLEFDFDPDAPATGGGAMLPPVEVPQQAAPTMAPAPTKQGWSIKRLP